MIITQNTLLSIGGCPIIVQHLADAGYEGLTRLQFVQKLQENGDANIHPKWWASWAKIFLYNGDAIVKLGEYIANQIYRVEGMNIPSDSPTFTYLEQAILFIQQKQAEQVASEDWCFHVHAQCPEGEDVHTLHNCDLDGDGVFDHPVDCYQVFNPITGLYECFDTFEPAKLRCDELCFQRFTEIYASYRVLQEVRQINDPEENPSGWIIFDVGDALNYRGRDGR